MIYIRFCGTERGLYIRGTERVLLLRLELLCFCGTKSCQICLQLGSAETAAERSSLTSFMKMALHHSQHLSSHILALQQIRTVQGSNHDFCAMTFPTICQPSSVII
jgi:hypothetical protein